MIRCWSPNISLPHLTVHSRCKLTYRFFFWLSFLGCRYSTHHAAGRPSPTRGYHLPQVALFYSTAAAALGLFTDTCHALGGWSWNLSSPIFTCFFQQKIEFEMVESLGNTWKPQKCGFPFPLVNFQLCMSLRYSCIFGWSLFYFDFQIFLNQCKNEGGIHILNLSAQDRWWDRHLWDVDMIYIGTFRVFVKLYYRIVLTDHYKDPIVT